MPSTAYLALNGGEVTPYISYRTNLEKHASSVELMENFIPMPFGGVRKRPGTLSVAAISTEASATFAGAVRIHTFNFSVTEQYILAFLEGGILRIYNMAGVVVGSAVGLATHPADIRLAQAKNLVFLVAPTMVPKLLSRDGAGAWQVADISFTVPPLLTENAIEEFTLTSRRAVPVVTVPPAHALGVGYIIGSRVAHSGSTWVCNYAHLSTALLAPGLSTSIYDVPTTLPSGRFWVNAMIKKPIWTIDYVAETAVINQGVTLSSSLDFFEAGHVGGFFKIAKRRPQGSFEVVIQAVTGTVNQVTYSPVMVVQGDYIFTTFGTWSGVFWLEVSYDNGFLWETRSSWDGLANRNVSFAGNQADRVFMRVAYRYAAAGTNNARGLLSSSESTTWGYVQVVQFYDARNVLTRAVTPCDLTTTSRWTEGAFSPLRGYPRCVELHGSRVVFASTESEPESLWLSKDDDLFNFDRTLAADGGIYRTLRSTRQEPILWIASQRELYIGTSGNEWVIYGGERGAPLTPQNFKAEEQTAYGSSAQDALRLGDAIYFVERQGRRLRELAYQLERESYSAADLTRLAEHITQSGIVQMGYQSNREPVLWAVRADGVLLCFAYNRDEQLAAWSRMVIISARVISVSVARNTSGDDEVFLVTSRNGLMYLDKLAAGQQLIQESGNVDRGHYLDGFIADTSGVNHEIAVPAWAANGVALTSLANGIRREHTVIAGKITLPQASTEVHVGRRVVSRLKTLPLDVQADNGPTQGLIKQAVSLRVNLYNSLGGTYSYGDELMTGDLGFSEIPVNEDSQAILQTGWLQVAFPNDMVENLSFGITHDYPFPYTLRCMVLEWNILQET